MGIRAGLLSLLSVWAVTSGAYTIGEVSCYEGGCLVRGWVTRDYQNGHAGYVDCINQNCNVNGWIESYTSTNRTFESVCNQGGCFASGWMTYDRYSRQAVAQTQCLIGQKRESDCMSAGWTQRNYDYGIQADTFCVNDNCAKDGWYSYRPDGRYVRAYCKEGACFEKGWVIDLR